MALSCRVLSHTSSSWTKRAVHSKYLYVIKYVMLIIHNKEISMKPSHIRSYPDVPDPSWEKMQLGYYWKRRTKP